MWPQLLEKPFRSGSEPNRKKSLITQSTELVVKSSRFDKISSGLNRVLDPPPLPTGEYQNRAAQKRAEVNCSKSREENLLVNSYLQAFK